MEGKAAISMGIENKRLQRQGKEVKMRGVRDHGKSSGQGPGWLLTLLEGSIPLSSSNSDARQV